MASLIPLGVSLGAKLLGGLFGGSAKKKQEEAQRNAEIAGLNLKQNMAEDKRLGNLGAGQSLLNQLAGHGFTNISPAAAASLGQRRTYDFSKAVPAAGAGLGSSLLSGLFGSVGDVASQYGINKQTPTMSAEAAGPPIVDIAKDPFLKTRLGSSGVSYDTEHD